MDRELERLKKERTAHRARLTSLLPLRGVAGQLAQTWLQGALAEWPEPDVPARAVLKAA